MILFDKELKAYCEQEVNPNWEERFFVQHIREYSDSHLRKVLLIGGLRGTGKTVGILQALPLDKMFFISPDDKYAMTADEVIALLKDTTKDRIVVDEFSWIKGYEELAAVLHGLTQQGKRVIISGTESISLEYLKYGDLIHRVKIIHTTYFSFGEFCKVFSRGQNYDSCMEYLKIGGLFEDYVITSFHSLKNYVDKALISNVSAYVQEIDSKLTRAIVYSIFYYSVCDNSIAKVPVLPLNRKSYEEFLEDFDIDPSIVIRQQDFNEIADVMTNAGILVKVENLRLRGSYRTYVVNPSITYQLVKCIYDLQELPNAMFGWLYESSCVCWLSTLTSDNLKTGYLEGRKLGEDFEIDFVLYDRRSAYLFEYKLSENTNLPQNASLVKDVIENVLADKEIVARFVIYNGIDKIETVNGKEVIYTSNYEKLAALNTDLFKSEVREGG